jgi:hypothetical protein
LADEFMLGINQQRKDATGEDMPIAFLGRGKLQGHLELGGFLKNGQLGGHHERGSGAFCCG